MFGGGIGMSELLVVLVIVLIIFGAGKLPDLGKGLGQGITFLILVLLYPPVSLDDLQRIGGSHQYLGKERVGIQGYGGEDLFKLFLRKWF